MGPEVDARVFEIVSFAILREFYIGQTIYWGWSADELSKESLALYKTGRCNANDGGIDFVMRPLGKFFQVTETTDVKKYFLDIDKVQRYPITFVVKSNEPASVLRDKIYKQALKLYSVKKIVSQYMDSVEEIINLPELRKRMANLAKKKKLPKVLEQVILQSKVEFNYS